MAEWGGSSTALQTFAIKMLKFHVSPSSKSGMSTKLGKQVVHDDLPSLRLIWQINKFTTLKSHGFEKMM